MKSNEKVPPYHRAVPDREYEIIYHIFSYKKVPDNDAAWKYVSEFLGSRKRIDKQTYMYLPPEVRLIVQKDGSVKSHGSTTQRRSANKRHFLMPQKEFLEFVYRTKFQIPD